MDGLYDETEYRRQKSTLTAQLETLVIPEIDAAIEAGRLIEDLPTLWSHARLEERHRLLRTVFNAFYISFEDGSVTRTVARSPFQDLLELNATDS